jgi:Rps23 Pro-64 3,4-dihydroxylase Tpa1-like proline 4-hydroxylase
MSKLTREVIAQQIQIRLESDLAELISQWKASGPINHCIIDNLLPQDWAEEIWKAFPTGDQMVLKRSLRELKYVAAQMDKYDPVLEETIYAFQAPAIVKLVQDITGLRALEPDEMLYAGGISVMGQGHFLNPHVDNSHDKFRRRYRVLNLLFYVSPNWSESNGGNLELWPEGPEGNPLLIESRFNRLVIMVTHQGSWHSVSRSVSSENRCCVSNYYFSGEPVGASAYFHVTSFRGRPDEPVRDLLLKADIWLRMAVRKFFPKGIKENPHYYDSQREKQRERPRDQP